MSVRRKIVLIASVICGALLVLGVPAFAQKASEVIVVPGPATVATEGAKTYDAYCAQCHGATGAGNGSLAGCFSVAPSDLTLLMNTHSTGFPRQHVVSTLMAGHAQRPQESVMPDWAAIFRDLDRDNPALAQLRVRNLVDYIELLQAERL